LDCEPGGCFQFTVFSKQHFFRGFRQKSADAKNAKALIARKQLAGAEAPAS